MSRRTMAAFVAVGLIALSACSNDDSDSSGGGGGGEATGTATAMAQQFGAGCAAVPTDASNPGSFDAMAKVPVATAASGNPLLSTLVTAVKKANLVDSLNSAQGITVFAPANAAFQKIPSNTLNGVLA